jgi:hypothetical protein
MKRFVVIGLSAWLLAIGAIASLRAGDYAPQAAARVPVASALQLPTFKLPYRGGDDVQWTGGPHQYGNLETCAAVPAGEGSGLDFGSNSNPNFEVLAIAAGTILNGGTGCGKEFGCQVAVKHDVGGTVAIYGHLQSIAVLPLPNPPHVEQGDSLGRAGNTGTRDAHLHLELRSGGESCPPNNCLFGAPIGWGDLVPVVDDWYIASYFVDGEGLQIWNYDGSAVRGEAIEVLYDFPYADICSDQSSVRRHGIARAAAGYTCPAGTADCEVYRPGTATQFAGKGSSQFGFLGANGAWLGGWLASTNRPTLLAGAGSALAQQASW